MRETLRQWREEHANDNLPPLVLPVEDDSESDYWSEDGYLPTPSPTLEDLHPEHRKPAGIFYVLPLSSFTNNMKGPSQILRTTSDTPATSEQINPMPSDSKLFVQTSSANDPNIPLNTGLTDQRPSNSSPGKLDKKRRRMSSSTTSSIKQESLIGTTSYHVLRSTASGRATRSRANASTLFLKLNEHGKPEQLKGSSKLPRYVYNMLPFSFALKDFKRPRIRRLKTQRLTQPASITKRAPKKWDKG